MSTEIKHAHVFVNNRYTICHHNMIWLYMQEYMCLTQNADCSSCPPCARTQADSRQMMSKLYKNNILNEFVIKYPSNMQS